MQKLFLWHSTMMIYEVATTKCLVIIATPICSKKMCVRSEEEWKSYGCEFRTIASIFVVQCDEHTAHFRHDEVAHSMKNDELRNLFYLNLSTRYIKFLIPISGLALLWVCRYILNAATKLQVAIATQYAYKSSNWDLWCEFCSLVRSGHMQFLKYGSHIRTAQHKLTKSSAPEMESSKCHHVLFRHRHLFLFSVNIN